MFALNLFLGWTLLGWVVALVWARTKDPQDPFAQREALARAGRSERAAKALRLGMVDEVVPPSILRDVTIAAARRMADRGVMLRRRRGGLMGLLLDGNPLGRLLVFRLARKQVLSQTKGNYPAPLAALEAVQDGYAHGVDHGRKRLALDQLHRVEMHAALMTDEINRDDV